MPVQPIAEIQDLFRIIPLQKLRRTPGVFFDALPMEFLPSIEAIDRVIHQKGAVSPGPVGDVELPWYMHPCQDDNLIVLHGTRYVWISSRKHHKVERFTVQPDQIYHNDELVCDQPAMLVWPHGVFHRIKSCDVTGSCSLNLAVHYTGFSLENNFNIYDLDPATGTYTLIREGYLDQRFPE